MIAEMGTRNCQLVQPSQQQPINFAKLTLLLKDPSMPRRQASPASRAIRLLALWLAAMTVALWTGDGIALASASATTTVAAPDNSIAPTNPAYSQQLQRGYELLQSIGYK